MNRKKLAKSILVVVFLNAAVAFGWFWFFSYIKDLEKAVLEFNIKIAENERRVAGIRSSEKLLADVEEEKRAIERAFLRGDEVVNFIEFLEGLTEKSGAEVSITSVLLSEEKGPEFNFELSGQFSQLFKYLSLLERAPYQLKFKVFKVQKLTSDQQRIKKTSHPWQASARLEVLSYLPYSSSQTKSD